MLYPVALLDGVQDSRMVVGPSWAAVTSVGGKTAERTNAHNSLKMMLDVNDTFHNNAS